MKLTFTKMQGAGNDFVVIDATRTPFTLSADQLRLLCDRHFGVGCDQVLVVEPAARPGTDFHYRIFNSDGGEVQQCGNGARCFVVFAHEHGLTTEREIRVGTMCGVIAPRLEADGNVSVDMGEPVFEPRAIPFVADHRSTAYALDVAGVSREIGTVSMGNPHAVQIVDDVDRAPVNTEGPLIERHARFPERVNAGFMQIVDLHDIRLRVFERGAGETLACGSGACAAVASGIDRGFLTSPVRVHTRGGILAIAWDGPGTSVRMTGPAQTVFEGTIELPDLPPSAAAPAAEHSDAHT